MELSFFGMLYIFLGSAGNSISDNKVVAVVRLLTGMTTILFVTVLSLFFVIDTEVVSTVKQDRLLVAYVGAALMGAVLLILQFTAFLGEFFSLEFLKTECENVARFQNDGSWCRSLELSVARGKDGTNRRHVLGLEASLEQYNI